MGMVRDEPVSAWMATDVVTFGPEDNVREAMLKLVREDIDAGPVVDGSGVVVGMLSTGDLVVKEAQLHFPTVTNFLGVDVQWPSFKHRHIDDDISKALGATVGEVMSGDPAVVTSTETIEAAATLMHDRNVSRLPVVEEGLLVGLISRNDILRALIADEDLGPPPGGGASGVASGDEADARPAGT